MFLGGRDDGMFQVFSDKEAAQILDEADHLLMDGSWGATPLMSMHCRKRNHFRMDWTLNACERNPNDDQAPLVTKCASILFAVDKPSKALYIEALRFLIKRCDELWGIKLFKFRGVKILVMADFERPMRNAIRDTIKHAIVTGCWFHFCKRLVCKMNDLGLTSIYRDKKYMRGFL
eukprot:777353_1